MKKTLEQYKKELDSEQKEVIEIAKRNGNRVYLKVKCKKCGEEKIKNPQQVKLYGCRKCEGKNTTERQRQTLEQIKERLKDKDVEVIDVFVKKKEGEKGRTFVKTKCNKHGTLTVTSSLQIEKKNCCKECEIEKRNLKRNKKNEENIFANKRKELIDFFKNKEDPFLNKFKSHKTATIICPNCNKEHKRKYQYIYSYGVLCGSCGNNNSKAETIMNELLIKLNKKFKREKTFEWSGSRRYDFYLEEEKTIIETHGIQHYKENDFFKKTLSEQQEIDKEKRELAFVNGIEKYIEIDCSSIEKQKLIEEIKRKLGIFMNFEKINWDEIFLKLEQKSNGKQEEAEELVKEKFLKGETLEKIEEETKLTKAQIKRILVKLKKNKEIEYNPKVIKKKVFRYNLSGEIMGIYDSIREAEKKTGNSEQNISLCCRKINKTSKKEIFSFEELTKKQIEERLKND